MSVNHPENLSQELGGLNTSGPAKQRVGQSWSMSPRGV